GSAPTRRTPPWRRSWRSSSGSGSRPPGRSRRSASPEGTEPPGRRRASPERDWAAEGSVQAADEADQDAAGHEVDQGGEAVVDGDLALGVGGLEHVLELPRQVAGAFAEPVHDAVRGVGL